MRTAIYVYASNPAAQAQFSVSVDAEVRKYETPTSESKVENENGTCVLGAGIYKVVCETPPAIALLPGNSADYDVVTVADDKDPWPDPPARFQTTFSDVSLAVLQTFFPVGSSAFGASANDKSAK
jgi:hypothetical protein